MEGSKKNLIEVSKGYRSKQSHFLSYSGILIAEGMNSVTLPVHELLVARADIQTYMSKSRRGRFQTLVLTTAEVFLFCPQDFIPSFFNCV